MSFREPIRPIARTYSDDKGWSSTTKLYHAQCRPYKKANEYAVIDDDAIAVLAAVDHWEPKITKYCRPKEGPYAPQIVKLTGLPLWRVLEVAKSLKGEYLLCCDDMPWSLLEDGLYVLQQEWGERQANRGWLKLVDPNHEVK